MSEYVCAYRISFSDGGEPEYGLLHRGSKEQCDSAADLIHAVSYSGSRPVSDCRIGVWLDSTSDAAMKEATP